MTERYKTKSRYWAPKPFVVVTVEPQGPEEFPEPLVENKPLEVTEDQINPMPPAHW